MRIQKEIENVERVKNRVATVPLTMEDAVEFHKQVVDRIEKDRKDINKELGLDSDIEEKGFTGASKEPKKVSTPELKKMKLSESLFESLNEAVSADKRVLQISMDVLLDGGISAGSVIEHIKENTGLDILGYDAEYDLTQEYNDSGWSEALPESKRVLQISMDVLLDDTTSADSVVEQIKKTTDLDILGYDAEYDLTQEYVDSGWFNESLDMIDKIDPDELFSIADRYCVSSPVSGAWDTEVQHEQEEIAKHFNLSMEEAKQIMIEILGFDEDSFHSPIEEELEDTDGWGDEIEYILSESFSELENLMYEIRNCRRGSYTGCETAEELADYIHRLAEDLDECSYEIKANSKNINESLNEDWDDLINDIEKEDNDKNQAEATQHMIDQQEKEKEAEEKEAEFKRQTQREIERDEAREKAREERDKLRKINREKEEKERQIKSQMWKEKDWVAEREKAGGFDKLDLAGYSQEERDHLKKAFDEFDKDETAQARYKRDKEKTEREKRQEKISKGIKKAGELPGEVVNAAKKGLANSGIHLNF